MMKLQPKILKDNPTTFVKDLIKPGSYPVRIYSIIVMGTHLDNYKGVEKRNEKVRITFELPTQMKVFKEENGLQPRVISQEFNLSLFEKSNFRQMVDATGLVIPIGEDGYLQFNIWDLIGRTCILSIGRKMSEKGNEYNTINSYAQMIDGMTIDEQHNDTFVYDVSQHDAESFNRLPDFLKEKIMDSDEYKLKVLGHETAIASGGSMDEELDFDQYISQD